MTDEIASLGIVVDDGGSVERSKKSLASLAEQGGKTEQALGKLGSKGKDSGRGIAEAGAAADRAAEGINKVRQSAVLSDNALSGMITRVKALGAAYLSVQGVRALVGVSDEYTKYTAQLRLATRGQEEFNTAFANTNRIAGISQSDVSAVTVLYARLSNSLRDIGATQRELSDITETVSLALKVNGASAAEASSAMLQLSQAFGSGVLRGEEFNAVNEAAPALLRQVAKEMGVQVGQLRELASEGKITREVLRQAFTDSEYLNGLRTQVETTRTITGGFVELRNSLVNFVGATDKASGASRGLGTVLTSLARDTEVLSNTFFGTSNNLEVMFKGLKGYREELEKTARAEQRVSQVNGKSILPPDARIDQLMPGTILPNNARIDDNSATDKYFADLAARAEAFRKNNPLTGLAAKTREYSAALAELNELERTGKINVQEAAEYREQFAKALASQSKTAKVAAKEQDEFTSSLSQSYADLTKQLIGLNAPQETQAQILERMLGTMPHITQAYREWAQIQLDMAKDKAFEDQIYQQELAVQEQLDAIRQRTYEVNQEAAAYGKLPSAITASTIATLEKKKADQLDWGLAVDDIEKQIEAYKELARSQGGKEMREAAVKAEKDRVDAAKEAAKEIQREHERMSDNINRSLTDALLRGFESGKSFAENFRDTLKNMFSTLILRPIIQGVMQPVSDSVSSFFGGGSGGSGNLGAIANMARMFQGAGSGQSMSQIMMGSIGNSIGNIGSAIGSAAISQFASGLAGRTVGTLVGQGPTVAGSATGLGSLAGSSLGSVGSFLGSYGGYIGAGIQALQGDFRGAAFTAAGAAIGSIIPGIGTAIGALVGSLIGSLTGGKDIKKYGSQATGTYSAGEYTNSYLGKFGNRDLGAGSGLDALNASFSQSLGNLLKSFGLSDSISTRSDLSARTNVRGGFYADFDGGSVDWGNKFGKTKRTDINAAFQSMVSSVMGEVLSEAIQKSKLPEGIRSLFAGITDQTKVETMIKSVLGLSRYQDELTEHYNLTADSAAKVAKASGLAGDELNAFLNKILSTTLGFRSSGEAMLDAKSLLQEQLDSILDNVAVPETLKAFDAILKGIDTTNAEGIAQFSALFQLRDAMAEFTNNLGNIKTGVTDAIFGLKTPEQQLSVLQNNLKDAFAEVGLTVPKTVAELIALGESIDYTSEEGLSLAAVFPALVQGFLNTNEAAVSLASTLGLLDINKFKTQVDYVRAQHYAVTGNLSKLPSFDIGTNIVPKDMVAKIHEGERIIPAADNKELMQRLDSPAGHDLSGIEAAISELKSVSVSMAKNLASLERRVRKWDGDGLPPERLVTA